jgi:S-DNA-T family DNA segregation ATPase FtsK/SpoIIIE
MVRNTGIKILFPNELEISNQLGSLGAYTAFVFFEYGFGVASFLFCSFFFVVGVNFLFGKKVFSIWRNLRYVLVGIVVISVSASFFAGDVNFNLGGAFGLFVSGWLNAVIGKLGTASVIIVSLFSYFIWRFNPVFRWPLWKNENTLLNTSDLDSTSPSIGPSLVIEENLQPRIDLTEGNSLKSQNENTLQIVNLQENEVLVKQDEIQSLLSETPLKPNQDIASSVDANDSVSGEPNLEIKPVVSEDKISAKAAAVLASPKYDPIADLKGYKYPSLDLLAQLSSDKILMDQHELEANKNQIMATLRNYDIEIH